MAPRVAAGVIYQTDQPFGNRIDQIPSSHETHQNLEQEKRKKGFFNY